MKIKLAILAVAFVTVGLSACAEPEFPMTSPAADPSGDPEVTAATGCQYVEDGEPAKTVDTLPPEDPQTSGTLTATLNMGAGKVTMTLDRSLAPCAVSSFETLASQGYFDATTCHRFVDGFVLQCGDPSATGMGGPGYRFADELTGEETYTYGTVAMANAGPDTNGSQFFIMLADADWMPASYTVMGTVDADSMKVIEQGIVAFGGVNPDDPNGSAPKQGGDITSVTLS
ncbi:MAG: peptidylprolyl isomerase [Propionibacteriaceae bacterium]|nr:peptidylprolyl isomerase [Propionibacteriaceae bacterium]